MLAELAASWAALTATYNDPIMLFLSAVTWISVTDTVISLSGVLRAFRKENPERAHSTTEALIAFAFTGFGGGIAMAAVLGEPPTFLAAGNWATFGAGAAALVLLLRAPESVFSTVTVLSQVPPFAFVLGTCSAIIDGLCLVGGVDRAFLSAEHAYARSLPNAVMCGTLAAKGGGIITAAFGLKGEWRFRRVPLFMPWRVRARGTPGEAAESALFYCTSALAATFAYYQAFSGDAAAPETRKGALAGHDVGAEAAAVRVACVALYVVLHVVGGPLLTWMWADHSHAREPAIEDAAAQTDVKSDKHALGLSKDAVLVSKATDEDDRKDERLDEAVEGKSRKVPAKRVRGTSSARAEDHAGAEAEGAELRVRRTSTRSRASKTG